MESKKETKQNQRSGIVTLAGRPNAGKSTLINSLVGMKVSITSPRPQTTRFPIKAVLNEDRGQVVFVDTPGMLAKHEDTLSASISGFSSHAIKEEADILLYLVDITRSKGLEENRMLGVVRNIDVPKILVFNKIDKEGLNYQYEYEFLKDEFEYFHEISALNGSNVDKLLDTIFEILPEQAPIIPEEELKSPLVNIDRRLYLEETIREKVYLMLRQEIPYSVTVRVNKLEDKGELLIVEADIVTSVERYKGMIIGKGGTKIKAIGQAARKELETITNRKVVMKLDVVVDPHWVNEWL